MGYEPQSLEVRQNCLFCEVVFDFSTIYKVGDGGKEIKCSCGGTFRFSSNHTLYDGLYLNWELDRDIEIYYSATLHQTLYDIRDSETGHVLVNIAKKGLPNMALLKNFW